MVCLSCMKNKTRTKGVTFSKKDIAYYNMSYKWSMPTWQFFHSFSTKIQEEFYKSHISECLSLIKEICGVLPCPYCQSHANDFFKNNNSLLVICFVCKPILVPITSIKFS